MSAYWKRTILVKLEPDDVVDTQAALIDRYLTGGKEFRFSSKEEPGWNRLAIDCFKKLPVKDGVGGPPTLNDKLVIVAHGSVDKVGVAAHGSGYGEGLDAKTFAVQMISCGLEEIGLITFKSCDIGKASFLVDLARNLNEFGCKVGWLKGYTSSVRMVKKTKEDVKHAGGAKGNIYATVEREGEKAGFLSKRNFAVNYDQDRLKLVRGNARVNMSEGRYNERNPHCWDFDGIL